MHLLCFAWTFIVFAKSVASPLVNILQTNLGYIANLLKEGYRREG